MTFLEEMQDTHRETQARLGLARRPFEPVKWLRSLIVPLPPRFTVAARNAQRKAVFVDLDAARDELRAFKPVRPGARIIIEVAGKHGLTVEEIKSHRRFKRIVVARQEAMWRCSKETALSLLQIAHLFGAYDHSTVLFAIRRHAALLEGWVYRKPCRQVNFPPVNNGSNAGEPATRIDASITIPSSDLRSGL